MEKKPKLFNKGMSIDTNEEFQPEGSYRFMLNGILESSDGDKGSVINELGNDLCFDLPEIYSGYNLIGACLLSDNRVVLFLTNEVTSIIGIQDIDCTFTVLISSDCLNFSSTKPIDCIFKLQRGCDYVLYFTDNYNKYKSININNLDQYKPDGINWDCTLMNISPDVQVPDIYLKSVSQGGKLRIGAYQFVVRWLDNDLNPTPWFSPTNPVYITQPPLSYSSRSLNTGGVINVTSNDGFVYTNKSINLVIDNVDTRYKYYQVGILESSSGASTINNTFITRQITISSSTEEFTLSEINANLGIVSVDPSEITVPNLFINQIAAHAQVENRLLIGNHQEEITDWSDFQRLANEIQTEYFVYEGDTVEFDTCLGYNFDIGESSGEFNSSLNYSHPVVSYDNKTYMRDEIYALGIVFVFKNGFESPVFHIPGRIKIGTPIDANDTSTTTDLTIDGYIYNTTNGISYWSSLGYGYGDTYNCPSPDSWDTYEYPISASQTLPFLNTTTGFGEFPLEIAKCEISTLNCFGEETLERWKHVNTSIMQVSEGFNETPCNHDYQIVEVGAMGYFDTESTYPDIKDCNGVPIFPHDSIEVEGQPTVYRMHNIRHHLMPDSRKVPIHTTGSINNETCVEQYTLLPIGIKYSNIDIVNHLSQDVIDQIQGYYFVRGDRAGNKTVIDKGWMNVTDVTWGHDDTDARGELDNDSKTIESNKWFLTPGWKNGYSADTGTGEFHKQPQKSGFDIVEFFSPKTSFGEITNVGGDYYKLENTVFGFYSFYGKDEGDDDYRYISWPNLLGTTASRYRLYMYGGFHKFELPLMYNFENRQEYSFVPYKLPIQGSEYTIYNENNISTVVNDFTLKNDYYRQTILLSKLFYDQEYTDGCFCQKPKAYVNYTLGSITAGSEDIIPWGDASGFFTTGYYPDLWDLEDYQWIKEGQFPTWGEIGRQFNNPEDLTQKCRSLYSPYAYYASLKSSIIPYTKLESIKYIKTSNYLFKIESGECLADRSSQWVTGGDCFIARQQLFKSYAEKTDPRWKIGSSLLWGYVESEINSHYRHKEQGDDYYTYPWNSIDKTIYSTMEDLKDELTTNIEQLYKYRLDYSKDNNDRLNFPLADEFAYCSDCSGRFPHTVYYSEQSFPDELQDKYRIFRALNNRTIPSDTGDITNLIIKEENLFAFTENNLWRFNIAPQQLQTNNDTVQIGQGSFLGTRPVKLFDNKQGTARGGMEFKFSGVFGGDNYFWVDNLSGKVFSLSKGVEEISQAGMKRFFRNNLTLKFRDQFKQVSGGLDYATLVTTSTLGVGFHGVYDPQYMRYILHKRDFTFTEAALDITGNLNIFTSGIPTEDVLYYAPAFDTFFVGDGISYITSTPVTSFEAFPTFFKNESFTVSYSIIDKVWTSFHSYLPTFMYHDFDNFYTYYAQNNSIRDKVWKHNSEFFTTYCDVKESFVIDVINNQSPYVETSFDTLEYTSNVFSYDSVTENWREIQLVTFDRMFVYNNNQISNLKSIIVSNPNAYQHIQYNVNNSYANKDRNFWRINRFRDMAVNRLTSPESLFTKDWAQSSYRNNFSTPGIGWIDKVVNPNAISLSKDPYRQLRFTDKYLGTRLFFKPNENYKITFNLGSNIKRNKT